jgi:hypothetical protein
MCYEPRVWLWHVTTVGICNFKSRSSSQNFLHCRLWQTLSFACQSCLFSWTANKSCSNCNRLSFIGHLPVLSPLPMLQASVKNLHHLQIITQPIKTRSGFITVPLTSWKWWHYSRSHLIGHPVWHKRWNSTTTEKRSLFCTVHTVHCQ